MLESELQVSLKNSHWHPLSLSPAEDSQGHPSVLERPSESRILINFSYLMPLMVFY